jgi:uncharacterized RDD family membrane protein YckC
MSKPQGLMPDTTLEMPFPPLARRFRAFLIDSVLVTLLVTIVALAVANLLSEYSSAVRIGVLLLPIFIVEPFLVAATGGTVGHHLMKLKVQNGVHGGNISLGSATLRFFAKFVLGIFSFVFVLTTRQRQAFHDLIARSIVVYKSGSLHGDAFGHNVQDANYLYPGRIRRTLVIALYVLLFSVLLGTFLALFLSQGCLIRDRCAAGEKWTVGASDLVWAIVVFWLIVRGWRGQLYGCRRVKRDERAVARQ